MSNNNGPSGEMIVIFAVLSILLMVIQFILMMIAFAAIALTAYMTVISLFCWNKPQIIHGELITVEEARGFILRGLLGAFLAFVATQFFFKQPLTEDEVFFAMLMGYIAASLGIEILTELDRQEKEKQAPPPTVEYLPPIEQPKAVDPPPFKFASWEDEDLR